MYTDCYGEDRDAAEDEVEQAVRRLDGTWLYNTPAPGNKQQTASSGSGTNSGTSSGGYKLFRDLEAANKQAAALFKELFANPPFDAAASDDEDEDEEEEEDEEADQTAFYGSRTADGRSTWQRARRYYFDPNWGDMQNVVNSMLTVEVVPATVC